MDSRVVFPSVCLFLPPRYFLCERKISSHAHVAHLHLAEAETLSKPSAKFLAPGGLATLEGTRIQRAVDTPTSLAGLCVGTDFSPFSTAELIPLFFVALAPPCASDSFLVAFLAVALLLGAALASVFRVARSL
jgi:hypothetical protein